MVWLRTGWSSFVCPFFHCLSLLLFTEKGMNTVCLPPLARPLVQPDIFVRAVVVAAVLALHSAWVSECSGLDLRFSFAPFYQQSHEIIINLTRANKDQQSFEMDREKSWVRGVETRSPPYSVLDLRCSRVSNCTLTFT